MPYTREDVKKLVTDLGEHKDLKFEIGELHSFGLGLDVFDPESEQIIIAAQPNRRDIGQPEILLTADQVATEVASARAWRANHDRAHGIVREVPEAEAEAKKKAAADAAADTKRKADAEAEAKKTRDASGQPREGWRPPNPPAGGPAPSPAR